jgi:alkylation response protein AidB-like acyl-CoA dehydrogenase
MKNEALEAFRDSARDFLSRSNPIERVRSVRDSLPGFDSEVWKHLADAGWLAILVPEQEDGLGLGLEEVCAIAEVAGSFLLPEPFLGAGVQAVAALCQTSQSTFRSELLSSVATGNTIAGLAWQERPGQVDPQETQMTALADGELLLLNGEKLFVSPGHGADGWIVQAQSLEGLVLVWISADAAGLTLTAVPRIDGTVLTNISFDNVCVPRANVLERGEKVVSILRYANDTARLAQSAELIGVARRALEITLQYMQDRVQFGKPIGTFQALQHRAVDAYLQSELASASLVDALHSATGADGAAFSALASRVKARCADAALLVTRLAIQIHGAIGFTDECDIGMYLKRALHHASWLGNATAHRSRYLELQINKPDEHVFAPNIEAFPHDADWDAMPEDQFRAMVRAFFSSNFPPHLRHLPRRLHWHEIKDWYYTLSAQGWIAPAWPKKFGGMGLNPEKLLAFIEEQEKWGVARLPDAGLTMAGPILIRYGTKEQRDYYLPKILSGEHIWSQGYSEPNAGSDLASLRTEAILDGDDFIVNGQKIWTTLAQDSTHIFMLVRTDKTAKKQAGISFLLVDMQSPGITVRVIKDLVGHEHFCEVFFDKVRVPRSNLVGELNQGWTIAKALLGFERIFLGSPKQSQQALAKLRDLARENYLFDDAAFAARFAALQLDVEDLSALYGKFADIVKRGEPLPASVSLLKIFATETYRNIGTLLAEAGDEYGGNSLEEAQDRAIDNLLTPLFNATSATIYGGSNEIQRNIIAKAVLNLPD